MSTNTNTTSPKQAPVSRRKNLFLVAFVCAIVVLGVGYVSLRPSTAIPTPALAPGQTPIVPSTIDALESWNQWLDLFMLDVKAVKCNGILLQYERTLWEYASAMFARDQFWANLTEDEDLIIEAYLKQKKECDELEKERDLLKKELDEALEETRKQ